MDNVILLADKNSCAWGFAEKIRDYISEECEPICLESVSIQQFRNKELDIYIPANVRKKEVYFIHDASKNPQDWLTQLVLIEDALKRASVGEICLVLPNLPYERKDWKDRPHVPISARKIAKIISEDADRMITMDLHSPQIQGFYDIPVDALEGFLDVVDYLIRDRSFNLENLVVVAADVGGAKRTRNFAEKLERILRESKLNIEIPMAIIDKRRVRGEVDEMRLIGEVKDKDVIIYEDMIDSGGTLKSAAELLRREGAKKLVAYGTHGIFTEDADLKLSNLYDRLMVSNTIPYTPRGKVEVIDVSHTFAKAIYRAQKGLSISNLFK
ncbi:MAG: ribose-phosphate diphosphokinase [Candidatus Pacearchaeota archaeon]